MDAILHDLRYAVRRLRNAPGFTVIVVATLVLAIGATTAVFSIVDAVLLNPLGFARADRLVYVQSTDPRGNPMPTSPQDLIDYGDRTHSFVDVAAVDGGRSVSFTRESQPAVRIGAARVGASFFSLLGVDAARGRTFAPGEDAKDAAKVVVLSDRAWHKYFAADSTVIGRRMTLDGDAYTIVGIAPPRFTFPADPDVWYPAVWREWEIGDTHRGFHIVSGIARLRDGATLASATRDVQAVASDIAREFPQYDARIGARLSPLREQIVGNVERPLWAMLGAVALVLLIACANVANLLLVRAASREPEIAVRAALGAGRRRVLQQMLVESALLAIVGTALGALLASWIVDAVVRYSPNVLPRAAEIGVDGRVLGFDVALALVTTVAFGLIPALYAARADFAALLRSGSRGLTLGGDRTRSTLVVLELALGMVLLVGAGLLLRSFERLTHVDPGFRADHVVVFDVALKGKQYEYDPAQIAFADQVLARLAAIPGVRSAAVAADRPFDTDRSFEASTSFTVDGAPRPPRGMEHESRILPVSPDFFATIGMTFVRGRPFTESENRLDASPVIVVNEALARRYFPGQDPIGKHVTFGLSHDFGPQPGDTVRARGEIVGVVKDVRNNALDAPPEPATYFPYRTLPLGPTFVLRVQTDPQSVMSAVREQVAAVDRNQPIYQLGRMDDALGASVARPRFYTLLLACFSALALFLAALGTYGVVSYAAQQRTREFGVRLALGATPSAVARLVVRRGFALAVAGVSVGLVVAAIATRALDGLLFGIQHMDAPTFIVVSVILTAIALLAAWLPARRASRVDPLAAMRAE
jgi:putative ABC transport system permease protein